MKKGFYLLTILIAMLTLTGCGKIRGVLEKEMTPEQKLCDALDSRIESYQKKEMTFDQFIEEVKPLYETHCKETNNTCVSIDAIIRTSNIDYTKQDCSKMANKALKELCESSNKLKDSLLKNRDKTQDAEVSNLSYQCKLAREK